jgi:hypothetical protein
MFLFKPLILIISIFTATFLIISIDYIKIDNEYEICNVNQTTCAKLVLFYTSAMLFDLLSFILFIKNMEFILNSFEFDPDIIKDIRMIIPYFIITITFPLIHIPFYKYFSLLVYIILIGVMEYIVMIILNFLAILYEKSNRFRDWINRELGIDEGDYLVKF